MSEQEPLFRVVRGAPTVEELAALVGVIATRSRPTAPAAPTTAPAWVRTGRSGAFSPAGIPARAVGDAWRLSGLPR